MTAIRRGEIVDVTLKGVRLHEMDEHGCVQVAAEAHDGGPAHWWMPPQAQVERVAPADWPPREKDVWRDHDGDNWYGVLVDTDDEAAEPYVELVPSRTSKRPSYGEPSEYALRRYGLTLIHRDCEPLCGCDHHGDHAGCGADCECAS